MRFQVEVSPHVRLFLRTCREEDRQAYLEELDLLRDDPIGRSQVFHDPRKSRFALRAFRSGGYLGLFGLDISRNLIRIIECRPRKPENPSDPI